MEAALIGIFVHLTYGMANPAQLGLAFLYVYAYQTPFFCRWYMAFSYKCSQLTNITLLRNGQRVETQPWRARGFIQLSGLCMLLCNCQCKITNGQCNNCTPNTYALNSNHNLLDLFAVYIHSMQSGAIGRLMGCYGIFVSPLEYYGPF